MIADYFETNAGKLRIITDISLDPKDRFPREEYARFLNRCKGQISAEAGMDFFEITDETRRLVNQYTADNPEASFAAIDERFFSHSPNNFDGRSIAGRNVEAAGTKTVQILFEGRYDGYLNPDVHYIPLKKDFSNIDEVMTKFRDTDYVRRITENAYVVAVQELTFDKLIERFHDALVEVL